MLFAKIECQVLIVEVGYEERVGSSSRSYEAWGSKGTEERRLLALKLFLEVSVKKSFKCLAVSCLVAFIFSMSWKVSR